MAEAVAPGAKIAVYFAPNTDQGFLDAINAAVHDTRHRPSVISISWGGPESQWTQQATRAMDQAFQPWRGGPAVGRLDRPYEIALMNQKLVCSLGYLNPLLYQIPATAGAFRDITSGDNDIGGNHSAYPARQGWDACTGLDSPNGAKLLVALG